MSQRKLTLPLVGLFSIAHVLLLFPGVLVCNQIESMFFPPQPGDLPDLTFAVAFTLLFYSTPLWGWLWAAAFLGIVNRRMRTQEGHCARCGYNLTGNVSGLCPECGTADASANKNERSVHG